MAERGGRVNAKTSSAETGDEPPKRIVLLDIDGVVIPATQMLVDPMSACDRILPATTIAALNRLCALSGAKIVFNTTHNDSWPDVPDIEVAMVTQGLDPSHLHPTDLRTSYPSRPRAEAVAEWLERHPEIEQWVAFDDARFTEDDRLVLIDPDGGLHLGHVNAALAIFGLKPILIFM